MTTLELNAELFRQLSVIAEDETLMRKAVKAIRRLAHQKEEAEYISKAELLNGIRQGLIDVKESMKDEKRQKTLQEVINEL